MFTFLDFKIGDTNIILINSYHVEMFLDNRSEVLEI